MDILLQTFGTKLRTRNQLLEVRYFGKDGNSPNESTQQFAPHTVSCVWLYPGSSVSADAVKLAIEHGVDLLYTDTFGNVVARIQTVVPGSNTRIQKMQLKQSLDGKGLAEAASWVSIKLHRQADLLRALALDRKLEVPVAALEALHRGGAKLKDRLPEQGTEGYVRGVEGSSVAAYWDALGAMLPAPYTFDSRSRMPANDPFNAALNYTYGILYAKTESALHAAGINPYIGFLHRDGHRFRGMLLDFVEPYRPWCDEVVARLFNGKRLYTKHFEAKDGGLWLSNEGKKIVVPAWVGFFDKPPPLESPLPPNGKHYTRLQTIRQDAHRFAQSLLNYEL